MVDNQTPTGFICHTHHERKLFFFHTTHIPHTQRHTHTHTRTFQMKTFLIKNHFPTQTHGNSLNNNRVVVVVAAALTLQFLAILTLRLRMLNETLPMFSEQDNPASHCKSTITRLVPYCTSVNPDGKTNTIPLAKLISSFWNCFESFSFHSSTGLVSCF